MKRILLTAALLPAFAMADVPKFDVQQYCDVIANSGGTTSEMIRSGCFEQEQNSYNKVKGIWNQLTPSMQSYCTTIASSGGNSSYMILDGCISQELNSKSSNKGFQFKY